MLFNLSRQKHFPNKGTGEDIHNHPNFGPRFETNYMTGELTASEPFNGDSNVCSIGNEAGYCIPVDSDG